jgi:hypothetical protein
MEHACIANVPHFIVLKDSSEKREWKFAARDLGIAS